MKTYKEHYEKSRKLSGVKSDPNSKYSSLYDISIDTDFLDTDSEYDRLVRVVSEKIRHKLDNEPESCHEARFVTYVNKWRDIPEIYELTDLIMPQIEKKVFHSKLKIEFVLPYRNKVTDIDLTASWLWHYDDAPAEFLKLAIYLNDTTENNGCFQYISEKEGAPVIASSRIKPGPATQQVFPGSRIPKKVITELLSRGADITSLVGPAGTYALFTPNIIHRATMPDPTLPPREALFFFIRPSIEQGSFIDESTNSILPSKDVKRYKLD